MFRPLMTGMCILFVVAFLSCGGKSERLERERGGSIRIGISHKPTEINPITTDTTISANLLDLIYNTLIRIYDDGVRRPELAESWETSEDGRVWTFRLRKDVLFHDGTPLTSADVRCTLEAVRNAKHSGYAYALKKLKDVRTDDPWTVTIVFAEPDNLLWDSLGVIGIAPCRWLEEGSQPSEKGKSPVGSGPYRFAKQDEAEIVLEANPRYFEGRPNLDKIDIKILPSQGASISHLIGEKVDMIFLVNPEDYGALGQISSLRIHNSGFPLLYMVVLNQNSPLFAPVEVRKALNFVIDRQELIERVLRGKGAQAWGTVEPTHVAFNKQLTGYPYQPKEALRILKASGWEDRNKDGFLDRDGKRFEFTVLGLDGDDLSEDSLRLIQQQLLKIGVKMDIKMVSGEEYVNLAFRERKAQANLIIMVARSPYDSNFTYWHSSQIKDGLNFSAYQNLEADRLLDEARFELDPDRRRAAFQEFQKVIHDDPPGIFLFWRDMPIAVHRRFRGVPERRMESLRDLVNVWVPKDL